MPKTGWAILALAGVMTLCAWPLRAAEEAAQLLQARQALTGEHKDTDKACRLLLEIVQGGDAANPPETLAWAYIYLGYIEDRAQNRQVALGWYEKAVAVAGVAPGTLSVARFGLQRPLTWIRHLDANLDQRPGANQPTTAAQPAPAGLEVSFEAPAQPSRKNGGQPYLTRQPPASLTPATGLAAQERRENFEALWSILDRNYAHFKLKAIDWAEVGRRYRARLESLTGDDDFYALMFQLVNELKDTHSWLQNYRRPMPAGVAGMPTDSFGGRVFVVGGAKAGWEVVAVDGMTVPQRMESLRPYLSARSSERAFQREASRALLAGKAGEAVTVDLRSPQGQTETATVQRGGRPGRRLSPPVTIAVTRQRFVHYGRYPSGLGYIRIDSFEGREEITREFDHALEALRDTSGLILDIRDNPGGFNHGEIVGRFLRKRAFVGFSYIKSGPKHNDLLRHKDYVEARGPWRYTGAVALLVNDITGSAADLFATQLRAAPKVVTLGTTTHGNLSGVAIYGVLPCGLVVRVSNGYISDVKDRAIEVNGNVPEISVEPTVQDYLEGRDPVLERAKEVLLAGGAGVLPASRD